MADEEKVSILDPFSSFDSGIADWANGIKGWAISNRTAIAPVKNFLNDLIMWMNSALQAIPPLIIIACIALIAWQLAGRKVTVIVVICLVAIGFLDPRAWGLTMTTLSIVFTAVLLCAIIGLPLGVLAGKSDRFEQLLRPVLDTMQTIPAFVYLVPVVMLVGIGNVSGVLVTIVFALPPLVRLTSLGIRQVNPSVVEAAKAFGASPRQILFKIELPLSAPSVMAGLNQTIMLALSMVVIASMIAVKGLGNEVLRAMGRLDAGKAIVGGAGIVLLAIVLDRITESIGLSKREKGVRHWWESGPAGLVVHQYKKLSGRNVP